MSDFQKFLYGAYVSVFFGIPRRVEHGAAFVHRLPVLFVEFQRLRMRQILYRFAVEKLEILLPQIHVGRILDNRLEKLRLPRLVVLNLLHQVFRNNRRGGLKHGKAFLACKRHDVFADYLHQLANGLGILRYLRRLQVVQQRTRRPELAELHSSYARRNAAARQYRTAGRKFRTVFAP